MRADAEGTKHSDGTTLVERHDSDGSGDNDNNNNNNTNLNSNDRSRSYDNDTKRHDNDLANTNALVTTIVVPICFVADVLRGLLLMLCLGQLIRLMIVVLLVLPLTWLVWSWNAVTATTPPTTTTTTTTQATTATFTNAITTRQILMPFQLFCSTVVGLWSALACRIRRPFLLVCLTLIGLWSTLANQISFTNICSSMIGLTRKETKWSAPVGQI